MNPAAHCLTARGGYAHATTWSAYRRQSMKLNCSDLFFDVLEIMRASIKRSNEMSRFVMRHCVFF
jgi:hypothetical protein